MTPFDEYVNVSLSSGTRDEVLACCDHSGTPAAFSHFLVSNAACPNQWEKKNQSKERDLLQNLEMNYFPGKMKLRRHRRHVQHHVLSGCSACQIPIVASSFRMEMFSLVFQEAACKQKGHFCFVSNKCEVSAYCLSCFAVSQILSEHCYFFVTQAFIFDF